MNARNTIQLIGNLGQKPVRTTSTNSKTMAVLSLATHETYVNQKGEKIQDTQWHNVVAVGPLAERILNYVDKGDEILVKGKMTYDDFSSVKTFRKSKGIVFLKEVIFLSTNRAEKVQGKTEKLIKTAVSVNGQPAMA